MFDNSKFYHTGTATSGKLYDKFKILFNRDDSLDDRAAVVKVPEPDFRTM